MPIFQSTAPLAGLAIRCQPDARLVILVREGHERAFEEIVRRYRGSLTSFASAIVPGHRAEDVVQEAFASAHSALASGVAEIKLKPWLYTIVRNRALNDLRDEPVHEHLDESFDGVPQPPDLAATREDLATLVASMKDLPAAQREALARRELEGRSHEEIAAALGVSAGAVRGLIFRARTTLRDGLGLLIPMPAVRGLLDAGPLQTEATGAGIGGAAAGLTAGGGGTAVLKAGAMLAVAGLAIGGGVAMHHHGDKGGTSTVAVVAEHSRAGGSKHDLVSGDPGVTARSASSNLGGADGGGGGSAGSSTDRPGGSGSSQSPTGAGATGRGGGDDHSGSGSGGQENDGSGPQGGGSGSGDPVGSSGDDGASAGTGGSDAGDTGTGGDTSDTSGVGTTTTDGGGTTTTDGGGTTITHDGGHDTTSPDLPD